MKTNDRTESILQNLSITFFVVGVILIPVGLVFWLPSLMGTLTLDSASVTQASIGRGSYMLGFFFVVLAWFLSTKKQRIVPVEFCILGIVFFLVGEFWSLTSPTLIGSASSLLLSFAGWGFLIGGMVAFIVGIKMPRQIRQ
jgi:hypothetical protein